MLGTLLFGSFFLLLLIGTPIAVCLGSSSVFAMLFDGAGRPLDTIMTTLPRIVSSSTSKFVLMAIPFFILGGNIMEKAGISERLINLAQTFVGHMKGGAHRCMCWRCMFLRCNLWLWTCNGCGTRHDPNSCDG